VRFVGVRLLGDLGVIIICVLDLELLRLVETEGVRFTTICVLDLGVRVVVVVVVVVSFCLRIFRFRVAVVVEVEWE